MESEAWLATVHSVVKSHKQLMQLGTQAHISTNAQMKLSELNIMKGREIKYSVPVKQVLNYMTRTCLRKTYYKSHTENDNISEVCYHYLQTDRKKTSADIAAL